MTEASSPIIDFYPVDFETDLEGKRADWEGVVLIPFIDQERLLTAAASVAPERLTAEERDRNKLGELLVFSHAVGAFEGLLCCCVCVCCVAGGAD